MFKFLFKPVKQFFNMFSIISSWILHVTFYSNNQGSVFFYDTVTDQSIDGHVVVLDGLSQMRCVYAFRFEDRYLKHAALGLRTCRVFSECLLEYQIRPLFIVVDDQATTPFGSLSEIPTVWHKLIRTFSQSQTA